MKGGAFVHDPKLTGESAIKAQVKLQFKNASQNRMVITRSIELTVKKNAITTKAVDCTLMMDVNGERTSMTTKVIDLNKMVPKYLGVAPAILDNVIFCHQEESLWPMSEPSALKLKFDKIFDAQKYTAAIDNLNKMQKTHKEKLLVHKERERSTKEIKDKAGRVQKQMITLHEEIDVLRARALALDRDMKIALAEHAEHKRKVEDAQGLVNRLDAKVSHADNLESFLDNLRGEFKELHDSDESLQSQLDHHEEYMEQSIQQTAEYSSEYTALQQASAATRREAEQKQSERGEHLADKKTYENNLLTRLELVKEAARSHSLRGYDGDLREEQVQEFVGRIQKLSQEKDRELDRVKSATNEELRQAQSVLTDLGNRQATITQERLHASQGITANERKIKVRQDQLDLVKTDEGAQAALSASLHEAQEQLRKATMEFEKASWVQKLKAENSSLAELEQESTRLRNELIQSNRLASERAALEFAKKEEKTAQHSLDAMTSTYDEQLTNVVGPDWQAENLDREYQAILDQKNRSFLEAKKQQDGADAELRDQDFKLTTATATLKRKSQELQNCETAVLGSMLTAEGNQLSSVSQYLPELQALETERNNIQKDLDGMSFVRDYYTASMDVINKKNCCRLCTRTFADKSERSVASQRLQTLINGLVKEELEGNLKEVLEDLQRAEPARPQYESYQRLHEIEIPALEADIRRLEAEKRKLVAKCESWDKSVNKENETKRDVEALASTVNDIVKYQSEITKHQQEVVRLSSQQKLSGSSMSVDEIQEQATACDERIRIVKSAVERISKSKAQAESEIADLEKESGSLSHKLTEIGFELEKKRSLQTAIDELREDSNHKRQSISQSESALDSLIPELIKANTQLEDARRRGEAKQKSVQAEKDNLAQTVNKFKMVEHAINTYVDNDGPGRLITCERAIRSLELEQDRIDADVAKVTKLANELKSRIDDSKHIQRNVRDNIKYRKACQDLETTKGEISELEGRNAQEELRQFSRDAMAAEKKYQNLLAERGPVIGNATAKDSEYARLEQEWETDYKNAAKEYRETHIKVETTKAAMDDMKKCSFALENAIMKFHTLKMAEINAIAADLWRQTYQGSDIDTIMIRSENDAAKADSTRRNYNYRLIMVKQDVEMDMRSRCSAGQKVLASIIIRLALAECFGVNCGVIALDEPTTNLDRDNIIALAQSLHAIIKARKHQSNFQLIIITHDEEFLKHMHCSDFCERYWRVSRNGNQTSVIEQQSLADFD